MDANYYIKNKCANGAPTLSAGTLRTCSPRRISPAAGTRALAARSRAQRTARTRPRSLAGSPFKKPERQNDGRIKWTIGARAPRRAGHCAPTLTPQRAHDATGVLLSLGLLAFWTHRSPDTFDQRQTMHAAQTRGGLRPLVGATTRPSGGGMVEAQSEGGRGAAAVRAGAAADAAAAALRAQDEERPPSRQAAAQQSAAAAASSTGAAAQPAVSAAVAAPPAAVTEARAAAPNVTLSVSANRTA
ncbi:hypothetical protein OAO87_00895 [bacterium]|nr:hypothetical protein [bacterium]